jgi:hypothetical protein
MGAMLVQVRSEGCVLQYSVFAQVGGWQRCEQQGKAYMRRSFFPLTQPKKNQVEHLKEGTEVRRREM